MVYSNFDTACGLYRPYPPHPIYFDLTDSINAGNGGSWLGCGICTLSNYNVDSIVQSNKRCLHCNTPGLHHLITLSVQEWHE